MWILTTLNTRLCSLRIINLWVHPNNQIKRMVVIVWIARTELKNEFANSENVLYKRCFVILEKIRKKLTFFKLVKSNSLTTVEKI